MKIKNIISPGVVRSSRDEKPQHYALKIESFSLLKNSLASSQRERYESQNFNAGGFKWKLALYPKGDEKRNASNHISLYLVTAEDNILSDINVMFIFLVYDSHKDKYLTVQDGKTRRFSAIKREWGFEKLVSLETFNDASNGFLVNDCCVFGVDIFVTKYDGKGEVFSLIKEPKNCVHTWKIKKFSRLDDIRYECKAFTVENYQWKMWLFPRGCAKANPGFLSLYLVLDSWKELPQGSQVYVEYKMTIFNRHYPGALRDQRTQKCWYGSDEVGTAWGFPNFISLRDLRMSGLLSWDDTFTVKVKINVISTSKNNVEKGNCSLGLAFGREINVLGRSNINIGHLA